MRTLTALVLLALAAVQLAACTDSPFGPVRAVSSASSTNLQGAIGTAGDPATGGQGNTFRRR